MFFRLHCFIPETAQIIYFLHIQCAPALYSPVLILVTAAVIQ